MSSALRGIRRLKGTYQQGKTPILLEDLEDIFKEMESLNLPEIQLLRDKAILLIGFMGAFRRSEISALMVEDLTFSPQGLEIFVRSSKADQEGQGAVVAIPYIENAEFCAVRAVKAWLRYTGIKTGPIFRGFTKKMDIRKTALSDKSIAEIVKKICRAYRIRPVYVWCS